MEQARRRRRWARAGLAERASQAWAADLSHCQGHDGEATRGVTKGRHRDVTKGRHWDVTKGDKGT